jgi:hypothetical protein
MADNFVSYSRFTAQPSNIASYGNTVEEIKSTAGKPDANPAVSPFTSPAPAMNLLALDGAGSDLQRLGQPTQPQVNPYEGPQTTISSNRNVLAKLNAGVLPQLEQEVQKSSARDADTKGLMVDSFRRVRAMSEFLGQLNQWSETIQVRAIAASRN